jgi:phosphate:Na+ symporter
MAQIIATLVVGLGLFFFGLHMVGTNLKHGSGRQFRALIGRFTSSVWRGSYLGVLAGATMQSPSAVTVILASMSASGLLTVEQALPIVAWSNVGSTVLVFVTLLDLRLLVVYLVGVSAAAFTFAHETRWRPVLGVLLGIGLLFYGIDAMRSSAAGLPQFSWFPEVMAQARSSYLWALLTGILLSFLSQSSTAVAMLTVTLAHAGVLGANEAMMVIYGGNVGSTFAHMILAGGLKGSSRQIGHFQDLFKITGSALFVGLFYLEVYGHVPLVKALTAALTDRLESQVALVNLFCNLTMAVVVLAFLGPIRRLLDRFWPATEAEDFAKLKYLHTRALVDPETAIDLVEKEQSRLVAHLPNYINALRPVPPGVRRADVRVLHQAFESLYQEVQSYLTRLIHLHLSPTTSERLTSVHTRHQVIGNLEDSLFELVSAVEQKPPAPQLAVLVQNLTEALDFLVMSAAEAVTGQDSEDVDLLASLCADRGELLGKIRSLYLSSEHNLAADDKSLLLSLTTLFDRIVWTVRRLAVLLQQNRQFRE